MIWKKIRGFVSFIGSSASNNWNSLYWLITGVLDVIIWRRLCHHFVSFSFLCCYGGSWILLCWSDWFLLLRFCLVRFCLLRFCLMHFFVCRPNTSTSVRVITSYVRQAQWPRAIRNASLVWRSVFNYWWFLDSFSLINLTDWKTKCQCWVWLNMFLNLHSLRGAFPGISIPINVPNKFVVAWVRCALRNVQSFKKPLTLF